MSISGYTWQLTLWFLHYFSFLIAIYSDGSLMLSSTGLVIVLFNALALNYFGSIAGFNGIKKAPNSGYSVIIQKSYAIWTTIASVFLFNSELPLYKVGAIVLILLFTSIIVVERNGKRFVVGEWFWYSILAFFLFGGTTITAKYIQVIGDSPNVYIFWVMLITSIISIVEYIRHRKESTVNLDRTIILWLLAMSLSVTVFYWGKNLATVTAPNVGYIGAINAASNAGLVVMSALIFKDEFKLYKLISVIGVVIGLIILIG